MMHVFQKLTVECFLIGSNLMFIRNEWEIFMKSIEGSKTAVYAAT